MKKRTGIPSASTLKAIEEADRGEWAREETYEEFLDRIERQSPSLKSRIAKWRKNMKRETVAIKAGKVEEVEVTAYTGPPIDTPYARKAEQELKAHNIQHKKWLKVLFKKMKENGEI